MNSLQLELTKLIWKKELSFGCYTKVPNEGYARIIYVNPNDSIAVEWSGSEFDVWEYEFIGHPATLSDLHRFMNEKGIVLWQWCDYIYSVFEYDEEWYFPQIKYDSSKYLLEQSDETLKQIIDLIKS